MPPHRPIPAALAGGLLALTLTAASGCLDATPEQLIARVDPEAAYVYAIAPDLLRVRQAAEDANETLRGYAKGTVTRDEALRSLDETQAALQAARADAGNTTPPPRFTETHTHLLAALDAAAQAADAAEACLQDVVLQTCASAFTAYQRAASETRAARDNLPPEWRTLADRAQEAAAPT